MIDVSDSTFWILEPYVHRNRRSGLLGQSWEDKTQSVLPVGLDRENTSRRKSTIFGGMCCLYRLRERGRRSGCAASQCDPGYYRWSRVDGPVCTALNLRHQICEAQFIRGTVRITGERQ